MDSEDNTQKGKILIENFVQLISQGTFDSPGKNASNPEAGSELASFRINLDEFNQSANSFNQDPSLIMGSIPISPIMGLNLANKNFTTESSNYSKSNQDKLKNIIIMPHEEENDLDDEITNSVGLLSPNLKRMKFNQFTPTFPVKPEENNLSWEDIRAVYQQIPSNNGLSSIVNIQIPDFQDISSIPSGPKSSDLASSIDIPKILETEAIDRIPSIRENAFEAVVVPDKRRSPLKNSEKSFEEIRPMDNAYKKEEDLDKLYQEAKKKLETRKKSLDRTEKLLEEARKVLEENKKPEIVFEEVFRPQGSLRKKQHKISKLGEDEKNLNNSSSSEEISNVSQANILPDNEFYGRVNDTLFINNGNENESIVLIKDPIPAEKKQKLIITCGNPNIKSSTQYKTHNALKQGLEPLHSSSKILRKKSLSNAKSIFNDRSSHPQSRGRGTMPPTSIQDFSSPAAKTQLKTPVIALPKLRKGSLKSRSKSKTNPYSAEWSQSTLKNHFNVHMKINKEHSSVKVLVTKVAKKKVKLLK